jgi:phosphoribosylamine-glycine ligase
LKALVVGGGGREHAMVRALGPRRGRRSTSSSPSGPTPAAAGDRAYDAASRICFDGMQIRHDIVARAVERVPS